MSREAPAPLFSQALTRREILQAGAALGMSAALMRLVHTARGAEPKTARPNILFLLSDQHRGDCLGADGNRVIHTPNLDRIAREGARFRAAYTSVPSCTPARAGILTGLAPWRHGQIGYGRIARRYTNELPRMIRQAGYHTLGIGKMHFSPQRNTHGYHRTILDEEGRVGSPGFVSDYHQWFRSVAPDLDPEATGLGWNDHRGRPYALPERLHPIAWTGQQAIDFLQHYQQAEPFLLNVSFARPHSPYDAPPRWWKRYEDADLPERAVGDWAEPHAQRGQTHADDLWQSDLGPDVARRSRQGYFGNVSFIDEQIGRILDVLESRGWLENTLILYTSDHGDMLGDHHLWRKTYGYEPSARVPLLVRWPVGLLSAKRGQIRPEPVELRDILPTFLAAAGVAHDPTMLDGRSLLPLLDGKSNGWREYIDLEHARCYRGATNWTGLTDGRTKYLYHASDGRQQLFNLETDPRETRDLAGDPDYQVQLRTWRRRMIDHLAERGEPFVVHGDLGLRREGMIFTPNYPRGGQ